jgi:hypothetical protein
LHVRLPRLRAFSDCDGATQASALACAAAGFEASALVDPEVAADVRAAAHSAAQAQAAATPAGQPLSWLDTLKRMD